MKELNIFEKLLIEINDNVLVPFYTLNHIKIQAKSIITPSYNHTIREVDVENMANYLEEMNNGTAKLICEYVINESSIGIAEKLIYESAIIKLGYLWSDKYRIQIAKHFDVDINSVTSDIFGDLVKVRNCLIHSQGLITATWFKRMYYFNFEFWELNSKINITYTDFKLITIAVINEIYNLSMKFNMSIEQKPAIESPTSLNTIYQKQSSNLSKI